MLDISSSTIQFTSYIHCTHQHQHTVLAASMQISGGGLPAVPAYVGSSPLSSQMVLTTLVGLRTCSTQRQENKCHGAQLDSECLVAAAANLHANDSPGLALLTAI